LLFAEAILSITLPRKIFDPIKNGVFSKQNKKKTFTSSAFKNKTQISSKKSFFHQSVFDLISIFF